MRENPKTPLLLVCALTGILFVGFFAKKQEAKLKDNQATALELQTQLESLARLKCPQEAQKLLVLEPLDPGAHRGCERAYQTLMEGDAVPVARCITDDRKFEQGTALCAAPSPSIGAPLAWSVTAALLPQNGGGH